MTTDPFPMVQVSGSSYEMGRQHGEQASWLIERYLVLIERITSLSRDALCRNASAFLPRMRALSASFVDEVRGLADGAGISFEEALLCQVRGEAAQTCSETNEGCTAYALRGAATADGQVLIGQNQDMPPEYMDVSILLRVEPTDGRPKALMYTFAGQLGYFGMNAHGVVNYANSVYNFCWQPGLAHYPLKRVSLEQCTVNDVVALYKSHAQCSAANTLIADGAGEILSIESRPEGLALYRGDDADAIVHTNHYLSAEFQHHEARTLPDSFTRHARMTELVRGEWGRITVDTLKMFLSDHQGDPGGICRHGERGWHTTSGHIAEPQKGLLHVRRGHGCMGLWKTYHV